MELLAVTVFAVAVRTLDAGLGRKTDTFMPVTPGSPAARQLVQTDCRGTNVAKLSRTSYLGWAPYVSKGNLTRSASRPAPKAAVESAQRTAGSMAFDAMLPIKSLSAGNLLDYGFCLKLMAVLYLPADSFMDLGWMAKNRPLNRAQVECVAEAYSEGRSCFF